MSDRGSRREFLRMIGVSSGALLLGNLGCDNGDGGGAADTGTGTDTGTADVGADTGAGDAAGSDAGGSCEVTGSDVLGPFHEPDAPERTVLAGSGEPGERLTVEGRVYGPDCTTPISGALLDVWQADVDGDYHGGEEDDYRLRGQMTTDENGFYRFETIRPGHYPMNPSATSLRPAHIHFTVTKPGYTPLTTQMYFADDPYLAPDDPCTSCNSGDSTLIVELSEPAGEVGWFGTFDIVLDED